MNGKISPGIDWRWKSTFSLNKWKLSVGFQCVTGISLVVNLPFYDIIKQKYKKMLQMLINIAIQIKIFHTNTTTQHT